MFSCVALIQVLSLIWIGNGLGKLSDSHSEADAVRSAEAYLQDGLTSHHGLPRILHGQRFPDVGTVKDHVDKDGMVPPEFRRGFPPELAARDAWVYTHYPPGPNLLCGVFAHVFGLERVWLWRLLPVSIGLGATAFFMWTLMNLFGAWRGAFIAAACAMVPRVITQMPGLHCHGYTFAVLLVQISLTLRLFWGGNGLRPWQWASLLGLGFLQGWLTFDQFFVLSFVAVPLWLMRRTEGVTPPIRSVCLAVGLPLLGFGAGHALHFFQVAVELGGMAPALAEFRNTATERAGTDGQHSFLSYLGQAAWLYLRELLKPNSLQFGPFLMLAFVAALPVLMFRSTRFTLHFWGKPAPVSFLLAWPGSTGIGTAVVAALAVSMAWMFVMPQHTVGNSHITIGNFFAFHFFLILTFAKSLRIEPRLVEK